MVYTDMSDRMPCGGALRYSRNLRCAVEQQPTPVQTLAHLVVTAAKSRIPKA